MAKFNSELPNELILEIEKYSYIVENMMEEMTGEGAKVVFELIKKNLKGSFKTDRSLLQGLKISKPYKTPSDGGINHKVMFTGHNDEGIAIPLIAQAREYGTKNGEAKKPFLRKSFNKKEIENAMLRVQEKYIPKE